MSKIKNESWDLLQKIRAEHDAKVRARAKKEATTKRFAAERQKVFDEAKKYNNEMAVRINKLERIDQQFRELCRTYWRDNALLKEESFLEKEKRKSSIEHHIFRFLQCRDFQEAGVLELLPKSLIRRSKKTKLTQFQGLASALETLVSTINKTDLDVLGAICFKPPPMYNGQLIRVVSSGADRGRLDTLDSFAELAEDYLSIIQNLLQDERVSSELAATQKRGARKDNYRADQIIALMNIYELLTGQEVKRSNDLVNDPVHESISFIDAGLRIIGIELTPYALDDHIRRIKKDSGRPTKKGRPSKNGDK